MSLLVLAVSPSGAQKIAAPVSSLRVYLFDCGLIKGENPLSYGLNKGDVKNPDMVVPCYLIVHPKGTLMWDVGVIPDSAFKEGKPVTEDGRYGKFPKAFVAATGGAWLSRGEHHLHCLFALSFRSHGECECIRRVHLAGPCSGTGCDVRCQRRAHSDLQPAAQQQDDHPPQTRTTMYSAMEPSSSNPLQVIRPATRFWP